MRIVQVSPEGGLLAAGDSVSITVKFTPQEVEECGRRLVASIPSLAAALQLPNRPMTASVLRPWCHFDLPPSDYITAGESATHRYLPDIVALMLTEHIHYVRNARCNALCKVCKTP